MSRDTMWGLLAARAGEDPDGVVVRARERDLTAAALAGRAEALSSGLADLGLEAGQTVAVFAENRLEHFALAFALARMGAVYAPLNPLYRGELIDNALSTLRPSAVVVDAACRPLLEGHQNGIDRWITLDDSAGEGLPGRVVPYAEACDSPGRPPAPVTDAAKTCMVLFTSGTTGPSKGVAMSDRFALSVAATNAQVRELDADDVLYSCFAFCHAGPIGYTLLPALIGGATMAWAPRFSAGGFWDDIRDLGATQFAGFSASLLMLLAQPPGPLDRAHGARVCFTVGSPRGEEFETRFGVRIVEGYGLSECGAMAYQWAGARRLGSCGRPVPEWEVAVVDEHDQVLPPGTPGEIVGRPRQPGLLMDGYVGRPEATVEVYRNLWFHTGDTGVLDEDGFLWFAGRKKDAMRHRGENVSAWEVERAVLATGVAHDCAAYALPSETLGEDEVAIALVPAAEPFDPVALRESLRERLPKYALPTFVRAMPELPRTPTGKVKKYLLQEQGFDHGWHFPNDLEAVRKESRT